MRWTPGGQSPDIEDRRGQSMGGPGFGGPGGMFGGPLLGGGFGGRRIGLGGLLLLFLISFIFRHFFESQPVRPSPNASPYGAASRYDGSNGTASENKEVQFVSFVLDDVQKNWDRLLPQKAGVPYRHAKLVLFRDYTTSACGAAQSATGPFYCPADEKVYLDLGFFDELANRMGAPGEFGQAYVIAHELGHHVQNLLGIESKVRRLRQANPSISNPLSVRLELQADCLAGVWGHSTQQRNIIDQSDVAAGLDAVAAVGDDRIQKMGRGHVSPESFTHGTSAQRAEWFRRGLDGGGIAACNTFPN
ncbi:MAG TPA: neutral zinc metallopeptidase [Bryobacteraceae bacterium]|nr:neutral zinc metallopeptidase [Bryobacteraceae bacterium]